MPKKKKKESRSPFMTFLYIILVIPYRIASGFIKLLIGVPIYMGEPASQYKAFVERLIFVALSYNGGNYFEGKINVGLIYTMNAPKEFYESDYKDKFASFEGLFNFLNGKLEIYPSCNTLQVNDYSKYEMGMFNDWWCLSRCFCRMGRLIPEICPRW